MKRLTIIWTIIFLTLCGLNVRNSFSQKIMIQRIEPTFWWKGMKNPVVQLMVYGQNIAETRVTTEYKGVSIKEVIHPQNPNYLFVNLFISDSAKAGKIPLQFEIGKKKVATMDYEIKERTSGRIGLNKSDVMYLVMPDRFANGDGSNDIAEGMKELPNRTNPGGRHGGDITGVINHLDYIEDLGVTAVWLNPFQENNSPAYSYHGYGITDFYRTDPREGTNDLYKSFVDACHNKGMKVVIDLVFNHIGVNHWWMKDLPMNDWLNQFPTYTQTNFKSPVLSDPYSSDFDKNIMERGWFNAEMPDLNQENPYVATYLIQNCIWWLEYAGIDAIRMDTYPYPNQKMMVNWLKSVWDEYPGLFVVGETWVESVAWESYWQAGSRNFNGFDSKLTSITDFPLFRAVCRAFAPNGNVMEIYDVLSQDFYYKDPTMNVIFLDNHDLNRFGTSVNGDVNKYKLGLACILTTRGIPQIYYGTELMEEGNRDLNGDGLVRKDFPGGWPGDKNNAFTKEGRTQTQNEVFNYIQNLLKWRKNSLAIQQGKLKHYLPNSKENDNVYVYFRYLENEAVMVILNNSSQNQKINTTRFAESLTGYKSGKDIISKKELTDLSKIEIGANTAMIIEMKK